MTILSQIARPLGWLAAVRARGTHSDATGFVKGATATPTCADATTAGVQWVGNHLTLPQDLDASCYQEVITATKQVYASGELEIVVDLRNVQQIELSGLFALHCIALIMRGKTVPDPAHGWHALRTAAE